MKKWFVELTYAVMVGIFAFGSTFLGIDPYFAAGVGIFTAFLSIATISIKEHSEKIAEGSTKEVIDQVGINNEIHELSSKLEGIAEEIANSAKKELLTLLQSIDKSIIPMDQATYYRHLDKCISKCEKNNTVIAISSIDSIEWWENHRQTHYLELNFKAAERGVNIERIFIIKREILKDKKSKEKLEAIYQQMRKDNFDIHIIWRSSLTQYKSRIEDWVYFKSPERCLFVNYADQTNTQEVIGADLFIGDDDIDRKLEDYKKLRGYAVPKLEAERNINNAIRSFKV